MHKTKRDWPHNKSENHNIPIKKRFALIKKQMLYFFLKIPRQDFFFGAAFLITFFTGIAKISSDSFFKSVPPKVPEDISNKLDLYQFWAFK
jgi:hypothetical protein